MRSEVTSINLIMAVPELTMPCIFFLGKKDHCVSNEISMEFITNLKAPSKEIVWFQESKHLPFMDEPTKFNTCMVEMVKPMWSSFHPTSRNDETEEEQS
jgi:alpha-beta hydrolase superfamily lysophospholipase